MILLLAMFTTLSVLSNVPKETQKGSVKKAPARQAIRSSSKARKPIKIYDALKIAITFLEKEKIAMREYKLTIHRRAEKNEWIFYFVFLPAKPDDEVMVIVSDNGHARLGAAAG